MTVRGGPAWSNTVWAVICHEWRQLVYSPLTYIFLAAFSLILSVCIFLIADFFSSDEATLRLLITFLPWVSLVLVPALAMRSWGGEAADRGLELSFSLPVSTSALVLGRFAAGAAVLLIALACTAAFPLSVVYLGEPDAGAMVAGYLASALFLLLCFAICLLASALARDQVSAFLLGLMFLTILMFLGWDVAAGFAKGALPPAIQLAAVSLSPKHWLDRMATGHIEFAGLFYFISASGLALAAAGLAIGMRRRPASGMRLAARALVIGALGLGLLGSGMFLAQRVPLDADLTARQEFSIEPSLLKIMQDLPSDIAVNLYWSEAEPSVPVSIKTYARHIVSRLKAMEAHSGGKLTVNVVDPRPDSDAELQGASLGVRRIPMTSGDYFYLGATATSGARTGHIAYFDQRRQELLDYDLALLLNELGRKATRKLGILSPLVTPTQLDDGRPGLTVLQELKRAFDVALIPHFSDGLPGDLEALLIVDATILKSSMLYAVDQFVMNGGGLVVLMDPHLRSNRASNAVNPEPSDEINDLSDLLQSYGLVYGRKMVVGDAKNAATVMSGDQRQSSYPFWLRLPGQTLSDSHPSTSDLNELLLAEPGAFTIQPGSGFVPLIETSDGSGVLQRKSFTNASPDQLASQFKADGKRRILAAASASVLASAFKSPPDAATGADHLQKSARPSPVFAVADVDWIFDPFSVQKLEAEGRLLNRPLNDNWAFLSNMLEFAAGDPALISVRSRGRIERPFTKVAALFADAQSKYREKESDLSGRVANVEAEIAKIPAAAGVKTLEQLPVDLKARISEIRTGLLPLRRELREIRLAMRRKIESLRLRLTVLNLAAGPGLVLLFALLMRILRQRWRVR